MERNNTHSTNREGLSLRSESKSAATTSSNFVLQWGNKKRLRCMKFQPKDHSPNINNPSGSGQVQRSTVRVDRRVVRSNLNNGGAKDPNSNQLNNSNAGKSNGGGNRYLNLRQRPASPSQRILSTSLYPQLIDVSKVGGIVLICEARKQTIRNSYLGFHSGKVT